MAGFNSSHRLVIAEDDASVRLFLRETLEQLGHQVVGEAASGPEMVEAVLAHEPDLVLFDIHMPGQDGLTSLRQIYQQRVVAAVAITADRDQDLVSRATQEHVLAYLVKPVEAQDLGPALQIAWSRFQELRQLTGEVASLREALQNRKIIERAKGLLMKRHHWSEAEAFRRMQRGAMNRRLPLVAVAQDVLSSESARL
jgi:response regulator NasT